MFSDVLRRCRTSAGKTDGSVALPPPYPGSNHTGSMLGFGKGRAFALGSLVLSHHCGRVVVIPVHRLLTLGKRRYAAIMTHRQEWNPIIQ